MHERDIAEAELAAARAELKRTQGELAEARSQRDDARELLLEWDAHHPEDSYADLTARTEALLAKVKP